MAEKKDEALTEEKNILEIASNVEEAETLSRGDSRDMDVDTCIKENPMPSQQQEVHLFLLVGTYTLLFRFKMAIMVLMIVIEHGSF